MSSQRRIEASRANGARYRGPVTAEGKMRSAQNALRHGLLAKAVVLADEDADAFQSLVDCYADRFLPVDGVELFFLEQMAAAQWRQTRSWAVEAKMVDNAVAGAATADAVDRMTHAFSTLAGGPELALMHRYENRQSRMFQRALHNLLLLRKQNMRNEPSPVFEHGQDPDADPQPASDSGSASPVEAANPAPEPAPDPVPETAAEPADLPPIEPLQIDPPRLGSEPLYEARPRLQRMLGGLNPDISPGGH